MNDSGTGFSLEHCNARLLLVDDQQSMLDGISERLSDFPLHIDTALGGREACRKLLKGSYDLMLLDIRMEDINGHQVIEFVQKHNLSCSVIVVSGESTFQAASKALRRGADDYIKKPFSSEELIATISAVLSKQSLEREHQAVQARLQKSEGLHRYILNSSPDIVFMLDDKGDFSFLNSKVETLLGYSRAELINQSFLSVVDESDYDRVRNFSMERVLSTNSGITAELALKPKGKNSLPRYFEITVFPLENNQSTAGSSRKGALLSRVYGTARDVTERREAEEFINFQAYHDLLTRLPNRALFKDRLTLSIGNASRNNERLAVMFLDLDRFKMINDTLGHAAGDYLLQEAASRISGVIRAGDTLSRFGGDEFTLLLPDVGNYDDVRHIANKVMQCVREPFFIKGEELYLGGSMGIAMYPDAGDSMESLIQNADSAMNHVKQNGRDGFHFYSHDLSVDRSAQLNIERDLRKAIENNELRVFYQPQIESSTGSIIGVEALVRWQHPDRGLLMPGEFIPFAEESRLISDLGYWVMERACKEMQDWYQQTGFRLKLAVNFSPLQIESPQFVDDVMNRLRELNYPPQLFEVELTENVIMRDLDAISKKLSQLAMEGVAVSIDDFGTGYSSLYYLNKLPITALKIDRTFISEIQTPDSKAYIVDAIIAMAKGLRLNVIAEGVENRVQMNYLKKLECQELQGYLFSKPVPLKKLTEAFAKERSAPKAG